MHDKTLFSLLSKLRVRLFYLTSNDFIAITIAYIFLPQKPPTKKKTKMTNQFNHSLLINSSLLVSFLERLTYT